MKQFKLVSFCAFLILMAGCKKEKQGDTAVEEKDINITGKLVTFKTLESYQSNASASDKASFYKEIEKAGFSSLLNEAAIESSVNSGTTQNQNSASRINATPQGDDEDTVSLYPPYLLNILNNDSVVQIGNFLIKVDFVKKRALALASNYTSEYDDLRFNNFTNPHVMVFDEDDDVLEILDWIQNQNGSYSNFIEQKNNLKAPILCFDKGAKDAKDKEYIYWDNERPNYRLKCELTYQKAIIYFRLMSDQKTQKKTWYGIWRRDCQNVEIRMETYYKWVQRCKRLDNTGTYGTDYGYCQNTRVAHEGAKALRSYYMDAIYLARFIEDGPITPFYQSRVFHIEYVR